MVPVRETSTDDPWGVTISMEFGFSTWNELWTDPLNMFQSK
jgi:hypothetical protein